MATYDPRANGANRVESTTEDQVSALVNQILTSVIGARRTPAGEDNEVLSSLLAGVSSVLPMGYGPPPVGGVSDLSNPAPAAAKAFAGHAVLRTVSVPSVATLASGDGLSLPLRGVTGLLGGLLGLLRGSSVGQGAEMSLAQPFDFPTARNSSQALGPDRRAGYELDYRYDGQPRRLLSSEPAERRIEIHIQALDARSILDRKEDLAEAVRQAMSSAGAGQEALLGY